MTLATPDGRRLRADAERNRTRILEAAAEVFASRGLEATLHDIAHEAGVGVGTVYRRFPDKEALIEALFEAQFQQVLALAEAAAGEADSWSGLVTFMRGVCAMQSHNRGLHELMSGAAHGQHKLARAREQLLPMVSDLMRRAQRDGILRPDLEPVDVSAALTMLCTLAICTQDVHPHAWERYLDLILAGWRARPGEPPLHGPAISEAGLVEAMGSWYLRRRS